MTIQYVERAITPTLTLGQGNFGDIIPSAGSNNVGSFPGLRCKASISKVGAPGFSTAEIDIWGLSESVMNAFSALGKPIQYTRNNIVTLQAGDAINGMSQVFSGTVQNAFQDFADSGAAAFHISAITALVDKTKPGKPLSFPQGADVATVMSGFAAQMNLTFTNDGVTTQLSPGSYFWGSPRDMAAQCAKNANILWTIDDNTLAIWPQTGVRNGPVPVIGPTTGLVGYPRWSSAGVILKSLYNPNLIMGGSLQLQTSLTRAQGVWRVMSLAHSLTSITPGGDWFSVMEYYRPVADGF